MVQNKENLLVTLNIGDLEQLIKQAVRDELNNFKTHNQTKHKSPEEDLNELLTREQASKILKVSYTTLFHWNNEGILPIEKIGKRVYYPKSRIMEKLNLSKA